MQQENNRGRQRATSERSFKKVLGCSGYSGNVADKIWKWYNP